METDVAKPVVDVRARAAGVQAAVRAVPCLTSKGVTVLRGDVVADLPIPGEPKAARAWKANLTAATEILAKNGIVLGKKLGCGTYGCAFEVHGHPDVVLKLTGDNVEAASAQTVLASIAAGESTWETFPGLARIHCVYALARTDGQPIGTYALIQQKLRPLPKEVRSFINAWRYSLLSPRKARCAGTQDPHAREKAVQRMRREIGAEESRQARKLGETSDALDAIGVWWDDLHSGNVMQDEAGDWKIIDLGAGQSPSRVTVAIAEGLPAPRGGVRTMDGNYKCFVRSGEQVETLSHTPWIQREGKLGGPGYLSLPEGERAQILDHCVKKFGYPSCLGSIQALERSRAVSAHHGKKLAADRAHLVKRYGGPGSVGPRTERCGVERLPVTQANSEGSVAEHTSDGDAFEYTWKYKGSAGRVVEVKGTFTSADGSTYRIWTWASGGDTVDLENRIKAEGGLSEKVRALAAQLFFAELNALWAEENAEQEEDREEAHDQEREHVEPLTIIERGEQVERSTVVGSTVIAAWLAGRPKKQDNTRTDGTTLWLYDSAIGKRDKAGRVFVTIAGFDTVTTRSRLNDIPGVRVNKVRGVLHLNGQPWDGSWAEVSREAIERCGCSSSQVEYLRESKPAGERLMGSRVQSILFAKDWYTKDEARKWVQTHADKLGEALEGVDLRTVHVEPDGTDARYWHMRLYDPEQMVEGTWGTKVIKKRGEDPVVLIRTAVPRWRAALGDARLAPRKHDR